MTNLKLYAIIALGALLFTSTGYAYIQRERAQAAELRAATLSKQVESKDRAIAALEQEAAAARARARRLERVRQDVVSTPDSRACADSPAVRAALRGLFPGVVGPAGDSAQPDRAAAAPPAAR